VRARQFIATIAQPPAAPKTPQEKEALRDSAKLILFFCLIGVLIVGVVWLLLARHRRGVQQALASREPPAPPGPSAWEEAGRRAAVPPPDALEETHAGVTPPMKRGAAPVALVTGAAKRVGREIALELARAGCDIVFTYHQSHDEAQSLAREVSELGRECTGFQVDLANWREVEALAEQLSKTLARLDVVVHNASTFEPSPLADIEPSEALRQMWVNALAPLMISARLAPLLRQSPLPGGACIVAMTDMHSLGRPRRRHAAYLMSKGALNEMIHALARDLAPDVRVNGVAPGVVAWPEGDAEMSDEEKARYLRRIPLGRAGSPADAAKTVRWIAFEAAYMTGQIIRVDGGRWLT